MSSFSHKTKIRLNSVSISCLSEEESVGACFCERRSVTFMQLFSRVHATLHLTLSVGPSVGPSVTFLNFGLFWVFSGTYSYF